jgi:hypothetical protein
MHGLTGGSWKRSISTTAPASHPTLSLFVWRLAWVASRVGDVGLAEGGAGVRTEGRTSVVVSPTRGP